MNKFDERAKQEVCQNFIAFPNCRIACKPVHHLFPHCRVSLSLTLEIGILVCAVCLFLNPRLLLDHSDSFTSVHGLLCMRTQTAPLVNVPHGRSSTTTRVVLRYLCGTSRARIQNRVVAWGVQDINNYTTRPNTYC